MPQRPLRPSTLFNPPGCSATDTDQCAGQVQEPEQDVRAAHRAPDRQRDATAVDQQVVLGPGPCKRQRLRVRPYTQFAELRRSDQIDGGANGECGEATIRGLEVATQYGRAIALSGSSVSHRMTAPAVRSSWCEARRRRGSRRSGARGTGAVRQARTRRVCRQDEGPREDYPPSVGGDWGSGRVRQMSPCRLHEGGER